DDHRMEPSKAGPFRPAPPGRRRRAGALGRYERGRPGNSRGVRARSYGPAMRLLVARCEVRYSGRLNALLPEALRLIIVKADGSVLVHADAGGYKPLNWITPPTVIEDSPGQMVVRKRAGAGEDRLEIEIDAVVS